MLPAAYAPSPLQNPDLVPDPSQSRTLLPGRDIVIVPPVFCCCFLFSPSSAPHDFALLSCSSASRCFFSTRDVGLGRESIRPSHCPPRAPWREHMHHFLPAAQAMSHPLVG
uniref:Uncharacterized protein n=1 Tax=Bionectria ochroleuca TaxID=29856 RepID=A0A8H7NA97_BIOOC